ncbi:unnamed protein product [Ambrosiozyma monospora]|uniref:Unnamed protein product n=1 Tax=Ambrosiozyma monospora TaxID=43982 RepID=A0ACB5UCV6_AMBMO|nr:unnamed protein product [Ambrosiozyma monospora]
MKYSQVDTQLLVDKVYRRFNDVETLARKLQKEKGQQKMEIKSLSGAITDRIAIKNFKVGDLVLFLRTLMPGMLPTGGPGDPDEDDGQPWAVFTIGGPNYYLNNSRIDRVTKKKNDNYIKLKNRDWLVGRIMNIETRYITEDNFDDPVENPLRLTKGITWHFVEAKEEKFGVDQASAIPN